MLKVGERLTEDESRKAGLIHHLHTVGGAGATYQVWFDLKDLFVVLGFDSSGHEFNPLVEAIYRAKGKPIQNQVNATTKALELAVNDISDKPITLRCHITTGRQRKY